MADVRPFRGVRYDERLAGPLSLNIGPTYDAISQAKQRELLGRSEMNVIRLELAMDDDDAYFQDGRYDRAAAVQNSWLSAGFLKRDAEPSMYVMEEAVDFRGARYRRFGFTAAVRLEDYDRGIILPHEHTRESFVRDRLELMKATRANFSPLMVLFREPPGAPVSRVLMDVVSNPPEMSAQPPDMPAIRLWRVTDHELQTSLSAAFRSTKLYIADGHHRYEAALQYRIQTRMGLHARPDAPQNFRMMNLIEIGDPGLFLMGYHRVLSHMSGTELEAIRTNIRSAFDLKPWPDGSPLDPEAIESRLARESRASLVVGVAGLDDHRFHIAVQKRAAPARDAREASDYARIHSEVFRAVFDEARESAVIGFQSDIGEALASVASGRRQMAFIMRPILPPQFETIVSQLQRLPPKSTFFFPKLPAGVVIQSLEGVL
ncbi:MAG: DUF1015 domain-containing protein [Chloroflexi bacterium]|nr:DUF1015 domain-containing protein [Chloroflexota bacterium]